MLDERSVRFVADPVQFDGCCCRKKKKKTKTPDGCHYHESNLGRWNLMPVAKVPPIDWWVVGGSVLTVA